MKRVLFFGGWLLGVLLLLLPGLVFAATGKIAGRIADADDEGVMAAVAIVGTTQGAVADVDGNYVILGVVPGSYTVKISCVGYAAKTFNGVEVNSDLTTMLNAKLSEEAIGIEEQVIEYKAPAVRIDVSSKETRIGKAEIESRPVTDVQGLLAKQPGFKVDPEGQMHVRGGRSSDMLVKVDGVDFRDPLVSGSRNSVNMSALNVEEIEVMTGGDARYGGFQSALVNVTTPEGNPARYGGIFEWRTDRAFKTYSFNTDRYDYSLSGPVPFADKLFGPKKLSFFTSGTTKFTDTYTPYNVQRDANDYLGAGFAVPERQSNDFSTFWKMTYRMDPKRKLNLSYQRDFARWDIYPEGDASISGNYGWQYKYNVANRPWVKNSRQAASMQFTHNISAKTMYEVSVGNFYTRTLIQPRGKKVDQFTLRSDIEDQARALSSDIDQDKNGFADGYYDANRNGRYDGHGEGYEDANGNGEWDRGEDWVDLNSNGVFDAAEPYVDRASAQGINNVGQYDSWDPYTDLNGNGRWDGPEPQLPEQDWNHNGAWDGERFTDANGNGLYDGSGEGYDDQNQDGAINTRDLYSADNETRGEPFVDGDYWFDTGEPFQDLPDSNGFYNGRWDIGEVFYDLPSGFSSQLGTRGLATTNGSYDGPNGYFDDYELFTSFADLGFGMDPRYPVLYTWEDVRNGIRNGGREWVQMPIVNNRAGYLQWIEGKSTWTNTTLSDGGQPVFDIPNFSYDDGSFAQFGGSSAESFTDYNADSRHTALADKFLNPGQWDGTAFWMDRAAREWSSKFDLTSQVNKFHELKTGFEVKYRILTMSSIQFPDEPYTNSDIPLPEGSPYPGRGGVRDFYEHKPWEGAVYFQDKMEFEGMIVRAGLRSDFILQPGGLLEETQKQIDRNQPGALLAERGRYALAPRLGISHPISSRAKLYFNYGHYYQTPSFEYFYKSATANLSPNTLVGNPNLEYEKTIAYEVGVNTEFTDDWVVDVAGYYRDVFNQIGTVEYRDGPLTLNRYFNLGYARARGFEFSLEKKFSAMWALSMNYDYSYAYGKESAAADGLTQRNNGVPENRDEHPLAWDQTHSVSAYLTFMVSERDHPKPFGLPLPNNWLATAEFTYGSGYPYTPSTYSENMKPANLILANSARQPNTVTTELKLDKYWSLTKRLKLATGVEIYNLLNRRNVRDVYESTGNTTESVNILNPTWTPGREDYDNNPRMYSSPRQILLHLRLSM